MNPLVCMLGCNFRAIIYLQALDGFLLVVSRDGRILYVSESIANYLGLRQVGLWREEVRERGRRGGGRLKKKID